MKNDNLFSRIWRKIFQSQPAVEPPADDSVIQVRMQSLLRMVENTAEDELSCDEVFDLLDQYVELVVEKENAAELLPLVKEHLDRCRDCHEEYEALVRVIEGAAESGN